MLSISPAPIFTNSWDHRPVVSSPLSSSPIRASSPLSPVDRNALAHRQTQSSPLQASKFKYASRPARPNPLLRKREDAQESRRKAFLQGVRQKADEKTWQRRDIEGQLLRTSLLAHRNLLSQGAPTLTDQEIEDAVALEEEQAVYQENDEEMMVDYEREQDELEAMIASFEENRNNQQQDPPSPSTSWTDEDFDDIPMDFMIPDQPLHQGDQKMSQDHDMHIFDQ